MPAINGRTLVISHGRIGEDYDLLKYALFGYMARIDTPEKSAWFSWNLKYGVFWYMEKEFFEKKFNLILNEDQTKD